MKKILVSYTTHSGSTEEVARAIGEELAEGGTPSEVARIESVAEVDRFSGIVIGAPMMFGWHPAAKKSLAKHLSSLRRKPVAFFMMAMRLTHQDEKDLEGVPLFVDPGVSYQPRDKNRLSFPERFSTVQNYLHPVLKSCPGVIPVSVGLFGGKLDLRPLNFLQKLFIRLVIRIPPEDKRNWQAIRSWAAGIHKILSQG